MHKGRSFDQPCKWNHIRLVHFGLNKFLYIAHVLWTEKMLAILFLKGSEVKGSFIKLQYLVVAVNKHILLEL